MAKKYIIECNGKKYEVCDTRIDRAVKRVVWEEIAALKTAGKAEGKRPKLDHLELKWDGAIQKAEGKEKYAKVAV